MRRCSRSERGGDKDGAAQFHAETYWSAARNAEFLHQPGRKRRDLAVKVGIAQAFVLEHNMIAIRKTAAPSTLI